jgi:uncharacterized protein YigA (DUF484 family)
MSDKVTYTQIQNYLKENPGDLERLVLEAIPETKGAVSLAGHKLQLVSEKLALAEQQIREFIDVSTQNQTLFQLCHQLVQQLQKPQSIQAATARLGEILKATLDTRDYHLFIFREAAEPDCTATSFVSQARFQTSVGGLFNPDKPILGVVRAEESKCLFPDLDHGISSCAIIPLVSEDLVGALTIGSQDSSGFHREQDTLFIQFMGDFLAGLIKKRFFIDDPKQGD